MQNHCAKNLTSYNEKIAWNILLLALTTFMAAFISDLWAALRFSH